MQNIKSWKMNNKKAVYEPEKDDIGSYTAIVFTFNLYL